MSRLGKSLKNRFLAMALAGAMVITSVASSGMPVFAEEASDVEVAADSESQREAKDTLEEAAEEEEVKQREPQEAETKEQESAQENKKTEADSKKEDAAREDEELKESETDSGDVEELRTDNVDNKAEYTADSATLAGGHENAKWGINGTIVSSKNNKLEGSIGTYTNKSSPGDVLYVDATSGKFAPSDESIQIKTGTKIYIPVKTDSDGKAKIIIYQSDIKNKADIFDETKDRYLVLSNKDETKLSSEVECTAFSSNSMELTITLSQEKNVFTRICVEVAGVANKNIYATKIISGEEVRDDLYSDTTGNSEDLRKYAMEGYANAYSVTGGGAMEIDSANYHKVSTAEEFLQALVDVQKASEPAVIRITKNLNLGYAEIENFSKYSSVITAHKFQALMHPTLKIEKDKDGNIISGTGVSILNLNGFSDLTIFSTNGAAIKHCAIVLSGSENIIFRNLVFDELWEWDDEITTKGKTGEYDRNDWDYICVDGSDGVWIDHCTFYKAYDGVVDVKQPKGNGEDERVTISWCKFEPMSAPKTVNGKVTHPFYDAQIEWLEKNEANTNYYRALKSKTDISCPYKDSNNATQTVTLKGEGYTKDDIITYTSGQKKTHLLGHSDSADSTKGIRVTLANNSYKNSMDRLPRLRWGIAHEYNCVLDSSELYAKKNTTGGSHLTSNGAISTTADAYLFLENCYIEGIQRPLMSGNSDSKQGHIGSEGCIYKLGETTPKLEPIDNYKSGVEKAPLIVEKDAFKAKLVNYGNYTLYNASELDTKVIPYAGAGAAKMTDLQWTKTSYGTGDTDTSNPTNWDPAKDNDPAEDDKGSGSTNPPTSEPESSEAPDSSEDESSQAPTSTEDESSTSSNPEESSASESSTDDTKYITESLKFRVPDNQQEGKLADDLKVDDYFTIKIESEIKAGSKTIGSESFTKCVKFSGSGVAKGAIQIKALGKGTLTVYAESGDTSQERRVTLLDSERKGKDSAGVTTAAALTLEIPEKGVYYIASGGSSIFIYGIDFEVTYKEGETLPAAPGESSTEPPTFTAPEGDSVYGADEGNEQSKVIYNIEGYAAAANVTGGGLIKEDTTGYHKVTNEKEFLEALDAVRGITDKPNVIEITTDLNLGTIELNKKYGLNIQVNGSGNFSGVIRAQKVQASMHPTLKETGVSLIKLHNFHNLTIFSRNGATIKHAGILFEGGSDNIIIRNLTFDELWEWDETTSGDYDINDWDYINLEDNAEGVWIDHCTFYKAYDGILDMKNPGSNPKGYQRVTISWCEFLPGSKNNTFFNAQMEWLEEHKEDTKYYKQLRQTMEARDVWWYAYGQRKTHLFGSGDGDTQDKAINVTMANNFYKNSMSRLPRLRFGKTHEYNCVLDSQEMDTEYRKGNSKITGNGAISTCNGELLLENCSIRGIRSPLNSGNGSSRTGYINAVSSVYYLEGQLKELAPKKGGTGSGEVLITDAAKFKEKLPYGDYILYDATQLYTKVVPYAGAGKLEMSVVQWEKTNYGSRTGNEGGTTSSSPSQTDPQLPNDNPPKTPWDSNDPEKPDDENSSTEGSSTESSSTEGSSSPESSEQDETGSASGKDIVITKPEKDEIFYFTGAKIMPDVEVRDYDRDKRNGEVLIPGVDYTVKYSNNAKITNDTAKAVIMITGKGNYKGKTVTTTFQIKDASALDDSVKPENLAVVKGAKIAKIDDEEYTGEPKYPNFKLTLKGKDMPEVEYRYNKDKRIYETADDKKTPISAYVAVSNNVNKGTATLLITGAPDPKDSKARPTTVKKTFKITPVDLSKISEGDIGITRSEYVEYAVKGAVPETLTVTYKGTRLTLGKDYTVKYGNNKKAGQPGTITITGKGNYAKKCVKTENYFINKLDLSKGDYLKAVTAYTKVKKKAVKATVVDRNGTVIKPSEYEIKIYKNVKEEGKEIVGVDEYGENDELEEGKIYVQVTAKTGDKINLQNSTELIAFTVGINIAKAKVSLAKDETTKKTKTKEYKGIPIKLQEGDLVVTMKKDEPDLKWNEDYEVVSYENNVNKGTATAVIIGKGKYSGTKTVKFKIIQKEMVQGEKIAKNTINALKNYLNSISN